MPEMKDTDSYRALRLGDVASFNAAREAGEMPDLENADLRACDLRGADLEGVSLVGAYLKLADLRGVDLRHCNLAGASLHSARISGVYFPDELDPQEIMMSVQHGTRLRIRG